MTESLEELVMIYKKEILRKKNPFQFLKRFLHKNSTTTSLLLPGEIFEGIPAETKKKHGRIFRRATEEKK